MVDVEVVRLAKNVTLPMEDSAFFKDIMDRKIDLDLKKAYQAAGAACRPDVALTSVASSLKVWTQNIETALKDRVPRAYIIWVSRS